MGRALLPTGAAVQHQCASRHSGWGWGPSLQPGHRPIAPPDQGAAHACPHSCHDKGRRPCSAATGCHRHAREPAGVCARTHASTHARTLTSHALLPACTPGAARTTAAGGPARAPRCTHPDVHQLRVHAQRQVGGQRPGGGGPRDEVRAVRVADDGEGHHDRGVVHLLRRRKVGVEWWGRVGGALGSGSILGGASNMGMDTMTARGVVHLLRAQCKGWE